MKGSNRCGWGLRGIPGCSEDVMVARDILLAEVTGARYHVAHISSRHAVEMVAFAKARGLAVTAEATPHHLALADADMIPYDSKLQDEAAAAVACAMWARWWRAWSAERSTPLRPITRRIRAAKKCRNSRNVRSEFWDWRRRSGSRSRSLVHPGMISLMRFVELFTTGPARILGLNRGTLAAGAPG